MSLRLLAFSTVPTFGKQKASRLLPRLIHEESLRFFSQNIIKSLAAPGLRALITIDYDFRDEGLRIVVR